MARIREGSRGSLWGITGLRTEKKKFNGLEMFSAGKEKRISIGHERDEDVFYFLKKN